MKLLLSSSDNLCSCKNINVRANQVQYKKTLKNYILIDLGEILSEQSNLILKLVDTTIQETFIHSTVQ